MSGLGVQVWNGNDVRVWRNNILSFASGSYLLTSASAYWAYCGYSPQTITPKYIAFLVRTAGAGAQTAELGIYTSTQSPRKAALTMTRVESTGTVDSLTSTGVKRNSSAFTTVVAAGSHIWAAFRPAMATTQPRVLPYVWDGGSGQVQIETSASVLAASHTPSLASDTLLNTGPVLQIELD